MPFIVKSLDTFVEIGLLAVPTEPEASMLKFAAVKRPEVILPFGPVVVRLILPLPALRAGVIASFCAELTVKLPFNPKLAFVIVKPLLEVAVSFIVTSPPAKTDKVLTAVATLTLPPELSVAVVEFILPPLVVKSPVPAVNIILPAETGPVTLIAATD